MQQHSLRQNSLRQRALTIALMLWATGSVHTQAQTLFERTLYALKNAPAENRSEFASIALSQLAQAYFYEAEQAREEAVGNAKLLRWSREVENYGVELQFLRESVANGLPVRFIIQSHTDAVLEIADQYVILTHPRPRQQSALENQILMQFCNSGFCDKLPANLTHTLSQNPYSSADEVRIRTRHQSEARIKPRWKFTADGAACTYQGVVVQFSSDADISRQRKLCKALFTEATHISRALRWQKEHGVHIDWQQLEISALPQRYLLRMNQAGESVVLDLPILDDNPGLLAALKPWLAAQVFGQYSEVTLYADKFSFDRIK